MVFRVHLKSRCFFQIYLIFCRGGQVYEFAILEAQDLVVISFSNTHYRSSDESNSIYKKWYPLVCAESTSTHAGSGDLSSIETCIVWPKSLLPPFSSEGFEDLRKPIWLSVFSMGFEFASRWPRQSFFTVCVHLFKFILSYFKSSGIFLVSIHSRSTFL